MEIVSSVRRTLTRWISRCDRYRAHSARVPWPGRSKRVARSREGDEIGVGSLTLDEWVKLTVLNSVEGVTGRSGLAITIFGTENPSLVSSGLTLN